MRIGAIKVNISNCVTGIYLKWWFNGFHYFNFINGYEIQMKTESMGTQVTKMFSVISKIERPTRLKAEYSYRVSLEGITALNIAGFTGLLMAEKVEQYEGGIWREVEITRGQHVIKDAGQPGYIFNFEVTRKELPNSSSVYQRSLRLYLGDVLCDLDEDEVIPLNKQVNDIAEMQDRQSDFTAQFKVRKTRAMKDLFELSGEAGIDTSFPFEDKVCRLVSDNIEIITNGELILDKVDDQYYYVAILSGNKNFFKSIENLKLTDLTLASTNHTWNVATMAATHANDLDYVYPLCEPSDDGGIAPITDDGDSVEMYGGWIWPFIKVKAIWDEIFSNAGYYCQGDILTNDYFNKLFLPIVNRETEITNISAYHYSLVWNGNHVFAPGSVELTGSFGLVTLINGTLYWKQQCHYRVPFTATYKFKAEIYSNGYLTVCSMGLAIAGVVSVLMTRVLQEHGHSIFEGEISAVYLDEITLFLSASDSITKYSLSVIDITLAEISFSTPVTPHVNLPDMTQAEFVKMICNMFALVPDVTPRDKIVEFWNYNDLYENIPNARDWSAYLSERDDEMEFKFGEYAQKNYLRYKESDDVIKDSGMGTMLIEDETLPSEKDVVELPVSTCDEVIILKTLFDVYVSRINFNSYNIEDVAYDSNKNIDPRIVYVDHTRAIASPPYEKTLKLKAVPGFAATTDVDSPKKASSLEVSFSYLVTNYGSLSRLLTHTNLRRAKFNLPVYEVAGLKHYIPIYLSQYKAYFYVNKINNYVPGQLCTIDLIKL